MTVLRRVETFTYRCPIAAPVRTSFGTMTARTAVFVRVEDDDGAHGWGEVWCNFPSAAAEHRAHLVDQVVAPRMLGRDIADPAALWSETARALHVLAVQCGDEGALCAALAGLDLALHDLRARRLGQPLWQALGGASAAPLPVYASGINPGPAAPDTIAAARAAGHRAFKVKLGFGRETDLATLRAVTAALGPGERLMIDVNQGWTLAEAVAIAPHLAVFPLGWIEEPILADRPPHEWSHLAAVAPAPLAGGENLRGAGFEAAIAQGHLAVIQPDAAKWGGISGCLPVARAALAAGRMYCPHYLGGAIGLVHSLHLLAAVRGPGLLEVDVNGNPLRESLLDGVLTLDGGSIAVPTAPGLGFEPDLPRLAAHRSAHTERTA
jgi:L-alanine-DL-glutamate epimerase-like enolase superfamily enzyme